MGGGKIQQKAYQLASKAENAPQPWLIQDLKPLSLQSQGSSHPRWRFKAAQKNRLSFLNIDRHAKFAFLLLRPLPKLIGFAENGDRMGGPRKKVWWTFWENESRLQKSRFGRLLTLWTAPSQSFAGFRSSADQGLDSSPSLHLWVWQR